MTIALKDKMESSLGLMRRQAESGPKDCAVAWTGGKDSTVVLLLWMEVLKQIQGIRPKALNLDTGLKFPEVIAFRDKWAAQWGIDLVVATPDIDIRGYPVAEDVVSCCRDLKVAPLKKTLAANNIRILFSGVRKDEHPGRLHRARVEPRQDPPHTMVNPILDWTEMDVWSFIHTRGIPYCELYDQGYRSLGCMPCTEKSGESERSGRNQKKEQRLETLTSLGYF